jgi:hypothetical protein
VPESKTRSFAAIIVACAVIALGAAVAMPGKPHSNNGSDQAKAPASAPGSPYPSWPEMREFRSTAGIRLNSRRIDLDIPLYDVGGTIRYRLICRGGSREYLDEVERRTQTASYSQPLTCILNYGNREADASLLSEAAIPAYFSRGHFESNELVGECAHYPEYGLVRHFRLRGFQLEISLSNLEMSASTNPSSPIPDYALVTVSLHRDPTARTAKAEQPGYLDPRGDPLQCHQVRRGNERRMCRNQSTSAWEECPAGWEYQRDPWEDRAN